MFRGEEAKLKFVACDERRIGTTENSFGTEEKRLRTAKEYRWHFPVIIPLSLNFDILKFSSEREKEQETRFFAHLN